MLNALLVGFVLGSALLGMLVLWRAALSIRHGNSLVTQEDVIGQIGRLQLPCTPQHRGLVRLIIKGSLMDVPAYSCAGSLSKRLAVMVVEQRGGDVWVTSLNDPRNTPTPSSPTPHG